VRWPGGSGEDEDVVGTFEVDPQHPADENSPPKWIRDPTQSWVERVRNSP
jgi:hypothetical protein